MAPQHDFRPITFAADWRERGLHPRDLSDAVEKGQLHRAAPGIYVTPEVWLDQDLELVLACYRTGGVVALLTAAVRHGLCDASPSSIDVIVRWEDLRRTPAGSLISPRRSRNPEALTVGVDEFDFHGLRWAMTSPARTVVDLYRIEPEAHRQHALAALATYMRDDGDERLLRQYAKAFDCWEALRPEVEAINETFSRGMNP
jgi:hypothetical protein